MSHALVTPRLLTWSRLRAGLSEFDVADKIPVKPEKVFEWEVGDSQPTFKQAQKWALLSHIPFGFLFLKEPPSDELPLPDLRTLGGAAPARPSPELVDAVKDVLWKHGWYLDYLKEHEFGPLPFVGRFTSQSPVKEVVADMRKTLHVAENAARPTHEEFLRTLIAAAESVGILVMRSGIVGTNTHRKLDVGEFRGFAISNPLAPVVFINSADAPAARLFTLIHELAHVWINSSGISSVSVNANRREEIFCNAVAGEFLAPEAAFRASLARRCRLEGESSRARRRLQGQQAGHCQARRRSWPHRQGGLQRLLPRRTPGIPGQRQRRREFLPQRQRQEQRALQQSRAGGDDARQHAIARRRQATRCPAIENESLRQYRHRMKHLLDSNTLIEAKNRYYSMTFCPAFWQWVHGQNQLLQVGSISMVADELKKGNDELAQWAKDNAGLFMDVSDDATQLAFVDVARVVAEQAPVMKVGALEEFMAGADPWLIAKAMATDAIVVTHEAFHRLAIDGQHDNYL